MSDLNGSQLQPEQTEVPATNDKRTPEEKVADLLNGKEPEKAPPNPEAGGDTETGAEATPEQETEQVKAEGEEQPEGVDYKLAVPLSDGSKITLGELKDHYQAHASNLAALIERENQVLTKHAELQELSQFLQLPPELHEKITQQQRAHLQAQHGLMIGAIPEWQDAAAFERGRAAIFDLGTEYGVDLTRVSDHKVVKMLHDFARLRSAVKTAKANVKPVKAPEPRAMPSKAQGNPDLQNAIATAKRTGNYNDQAAAVDMLLRG